MTSEQPVSVECTVNGKARRIHVEAGETLLDTLRNRLDLRGTKQGCVEGECGACTVLLDDQPVTSCLLATAACQGTSVRTVESLATGDELDPLQQAFVDQGAVQCGFCTPGFLMTLTALVEQNPTPSPDDIRTALVGNICRCTGYHQMIDAVIAATDAST
jgi:aerobic-type carbon monoxide dehydrogenase small subunit (CoxS/CutS family)